MRFNENEEAVSPVIGVILMVAITVILAAVIAVFVFGMADDIDSSKFVAATAKVSDDYVIITYQGGQSADEVSEIVAVAHNNSNVVNTTYTVGTTVGTSKSIDMTDGAGGVIVDRVVVTAEFDDGTTQVILDKSL